MARLPQPELSTSMLLGLLAAHKDPRKRIHTLVKKGALRAIKQGIYLASEELAPRPHSQNVLANMIYGPSYVSLESALSHYGFIPERVDAITSVCLGNSRSFPTSVGVFEYCRVKPGIYPHGINLREEFPRVFSQFAGPEKCLLDLLYLREKAKGFKNAREYFGYVAESRRLDLAEIRAKISLAKLQHYSLAYQSKRVDWFAGELIRRLAP